MRASEETPDEDVLHQEHLRLGEEESREIPDRWGREITGGGVVNHPGGGRMEYTLAVHTNNHTHTHSHHY